ncbi:glycosyltransferase family 4 protein [Rathayibacter sp. KR2-224]|uniref:glycosyltransferase family 4 protein n=1 Tax=Rathayibacter sp. KR2-224 TaxID=3400913 RepID=UPI003C04A8AC
MTAHGEIDRGVVPVYHLITPGDHFSPRTGSAIPTVVHGLATGATVAGDAGRHPQHVVLQRDTYSPRYDSAAAVEYDGVAAPGSRARAIDAALGRIGLPRRSAAAYFRQAAESLRDQPPGIVLAHNAPIVPWLLRDQPHASVLYAHNDVLRSYTKAEASRVLGDAARIVSVSDSLAVQLREHLPPSLHERVRTVVNGVDAAQFSPTDLRSPGPLRVMFLGRAIPEKGADILLEAAAMVDGTELGGDELEYEIVGSHGFDPDAALSPYEQRLRELAGRVRANVRFEPFVDRQQLPALLRRADILVIPSRWPDPCPLTVGEGMATGLPIIAAESGGIPELLGDAGVLFHHERPEDLAEAIGRLASDSSLRSQYAASARARATERDWTWTWRHLAAVLDEISI